MDDVLEIGNEFTNPPIIRAARHADIKYLQQAIERFKVDTTRWKHCFDPNYQCDEYFQAHSATPLIEAARNGLEQHVALQLEAGAKPDKVQRRYMGKPIAPMPMVSLSGQAFINRKRADKRARFWSDF
ncbi:hypothetical protein CLAFUW4_06566 [Fulvia fulva]|uniref:Uncharacterized protein n=1 Tax=Passalora fulva TaxID=5499 RepID=A0A9Q8PBE5_PASFU|nr:uncharacterized protein CLAFUR5_06712 [Fulvia fulva]KAK4621794.1 hypothetical protein CLAFUR4_06574 [Fulvia fulva]KAK4623068.1 hypothetical protein CLAFUR0_06570 [Fulvia fulva]UJO19335.1 hypothetical protein CLAFUR5_06712 [Fulvia fulva]WPV15881.1 hypothetical protein CLAFUW4_06566 [Fulvia fulva]WPV31757.1 hypothetical protein CLAFUW7_06565 [Fulvia fulva]